MGIPGTASPTPFGFSLSSRWMSLAGTCPSMAYPPTRPVWQDATRVGIP